MLTKISGGYIYDPASGLHGQVGDLWIQGSKVIEPPADRFCKPDRVINAAGLAVMPGGVDMHSHIAGSKVNAARRLNPDLATGHVAREGTSRSGTNGPNPSTFSTGYKYLGLGYTTACDAAIAPATARHAHLEFADTPCIDKAMFILAGDHQLFLQALADGETDLARQILGWLLNATRGYALKLVNPGGIEAWKSGDEVKGLDQALEGYGLTPRDILRETAIASDAMRLPHAPHIHCNGLGMPGNWQTTLATMQALEGFRGHLTHIQFHSYGGGDADESTFCSRVEPLVNYFNEHSNITIDVGQVLFGQTVSMTADGAASHYLSRLYGRKWHGRHVELESGCGITPITYRQKNIVNAWQWAIGLEWFLTAADLWRVALTTDHPNGGSFVAYPEVVRLLMDSAYRRSVVERLPRSVREATALRTIDRELSLSEIAIITRAAPARILGMKAKGHLGPGADADVTIYAPHENKATMFALPSHVLKGGDFVLRDGEFSKESYGATLSTQPTFDPRILEVIDAWFNQYVTVKRQNYGFAGSGR